MIKKILTPKIIKFLAHNENCNTHTYIYTAYLIPLIFLTLFVLKFSVNVPFNDEWNLVEFFGKFASNSLTFQDFWSLNNDHRLLFPRIIFLIVGITSKWNVKLEMYLGVFLSAISFYLLLRISYNNKNKSQIILVLVNTITGFLFFSLIQIENWLWGFQVAWFLIHFWLIFAIFILTVPKNINANIKLYLAALGCFVASFSSAQGLFTWLAVMPCIFNLETNKKKRLFKLIFWLLLFIICTFIYLNGYHKPDAHPETISVLDNPLIAINYFLTLIGNSLFLSKINQPEIIGLIIVINIIVFNLIFILSVCKNQTKLSTEITPWISLSWFSLLFSLITTVGRVGFGVNHALASRYTTVSILLLISCLQIYKVIINTYWLWFKAKFFRNIITYFMMSILLFLVAYNSWSFFKVGYSYQLQRNYGKTCLEIIDFFDESFYDSIKINSNTTNCLKYIGTPNYLRNLPENFKQLGWINFAQKINFIENSNLIYGKVTEKTMLSKNNNLILKGWVTLPKSKQKPDAVLLSFDDEKLFFANAIIKPNQSQDKIEWETEISRQLLPKANIIIKVWVYDRENKQFIGLNT